MSVRGWLYLIAKILGDVSAVERPARTGSLVPIERRLVRRAVGRVFARVLGSLFR